MDRASRAREALAKYAAEHHREPIKKSALRKAAQAARMPQGAYTVFTTGLLGLADAETSVIPAGKQPTFRKLQERCGAMSSSTMSASLDHLERHKWMTRTKVAGRVYYELQEGKQCSCRPGRGQPMTPSERKRESRLRAKMSRSPEAEMSRSTGARLRPMSLRIGVTKARSDPLLDTRGSDPSPEPTEVPGSAEQKEAEPSAGFANVQPDTGGPPGASNRVTAHDPSQGRFATLDSDPARQDRAPIRRPGQSPETSASPTDDAAGRVAAGADADAYGASVEGKPRGDCSVCGRGPFVLKPNGAIPAHGWHNSCPGKRLPPKQPSWDEL